MSFDAHRLEKPRALLPHCIPDAAGLWADLGCGDGVFTTVIQEIIAPGGRLVGVDVDARSLQRLSERFKQGIIREYPLKPVWPISEPP